MGGGRPGQVAPDPEEERRLRIRQRVLVFVLSSVFLAGVLAALFGERGYLDLRRSRRALSELERQHAVQQQRVGELEQQIARLRDDPAAVERLAREQLGLVRPGEILFLLPRDEAGDETKRGGGGDGDRGSGRGDDGSGRDRRGEASEE